jgi:tetratricopeptide (TPR) repeat protein
MITAPGRLEGGEGMPLSLDHAQRLQRAVVLTELGELSEAEADVAHVLEERPEDLEALSLYAKLKHMRGELSLAVACEAQLHAKRPVPGETARTHLESMLHLAQDPERGVGEFIAVGQFQLVQKPTAYLALEEAFRHYVGRHPNEARSHCRHVASRYRESDPEVYKLAMLADAWISEMIGDLPAACETLERLGAERGYETDLDRIMALVSIYERIGSREKLEAAVNVCRYLERSYSPSPVLGRLALLYRRLDQPDVAEEYARLHLVAYRRAMHRPTLRDVIEVAAHSYLPIHRLRSLRLNGEDSRQEAPSRQHGIARAIQGDLQEARASFKGGEELLDRKYLAEIEELEHGPERATPHYVAVLRQDPRDLHLLERVLDFVQSQHSRAITELFRDSTFASQALAALESKVQMDPGNPRIWRRLAALFGMRPGGREQQQQFSTRADAVEQAARARDRAIGRVLSAATYRFVGKVQGLIHEVWASREMAAPGRGGTLRKEDILGSHTDEMKDHVRTTFGAVREFAQSKFPHATRELLD